MVAPTPLKPLHLTAKTCNCSFNRYFLPVFLHSRWTIYHMFMCQALLYWKIDHRNTDFPTISITRSLGLLPIPCCYSPEKRLRAILQSLSFSETYCARSLKWEVSSPRLVPLAGMASPEPLSALAVGTRMILLWREKARNLCLRCGVPQGIG